EEARGVDIWRPVCCLAEHFGLLTKERLQGLNVIVRDLLVIDMAELVRMQIYVELDDTWAWVPPGSERHTRAGTSAATTATRLAQTMA
nr:hypothetical protein [Tanacetum cinerariifolium]